MKTLTLILIVALALMFGACSNKDKAAADAGQMSADMSASEMSASGHTIVGCWQIENVVVNDTLYARPIETSPDVKQYMTFTADSTFVVNTNCNIISGNYEASGSESIRFSNCSWTEMACDDMSVENLLKQILPAVTTVDFENDSITRLNTDSTMYVVLRKSPHALKSATK